MDVAALIFSIVAWSQDIKVECSIHMWGSLSMRIAPILFVIICTLLLPMPRLTVFENAVAADDGSVRNLRTGINYTSIGEAIADNSTVNGDAIFIGSGVYYEHVLVNKTLSLIGEGNENTTVDGNGTGPIIQIKASGVNVSNLKIQNAFSPNLIDSGIFAEASPYGTFNDLFLQNLGCGILLRESGDCIVENNSILSSGLGIFAFNSNSTNLTENSVADGYFGIVINNSTGCLLRRNQIVNCTDGFGAAGSLLEQCINDIDTSNTIDGKFIYYVLNLTGTTINPDTFPNAGSVTVLNSSGVIVENLVLTRSGVSVGLLFTSDTIVRNVSASGSLNGGGIATYVGTNVTIESNTVTDSFQGISVQVSESIVRGNTVTNGFMGLALRNSYNDTIIENNVTNYERCITVDNSFYNSIFHNNFVNYSTTSLFYSPINSWDNGAEGNYWSENPLIDANNDGISDAPVVLSEHNTDRFPLMGIFHTFDLTFDHGRYTFHLVTNSSLLDYRVIAWLASPNEYFFPGEQYIKLGVTGENGTQGFIRISMLRAALYNATYYNVILDDQWPPTNATVLSSSNETYVYLYFNYTHSQHSISIVPEFTTMIYVLFIFASLLMLSVHRKKQRYQFSYSSSSL